MRLGVGVGVGCRDCETSTAGILGWISDAIAGGPQKRRRAMDAMEKAQAFAQEAEELELVRDRLRQQLDQRGGGLSGQLLWLVPVVVLGALAYRRFA